VVQAGSISSYERNAATNANKGGTMTSPVAPVTDQSQGGTSGSSSLGTAGLLDPSTFLSLLVDELKYQNPLDPTSSSDFMSQIAQLSQVEQLQSVSSASQMGEAAGLIGKTVTANDGSGNTISGTVTGVTNGSSGPLLDVGSSTVSLSDVQQIDAGDPAS
jgi:flagellar basal-body rod modification protein FlgD